MKNSEKLLLLLIQEVKASSLKVKQENNSFVFTPSIDDFKTLEFFHLIKGGKITNRGFNYESLPSPKTLSNKGLENGIVKMISELSKRVDERTMQVSQSIYDELETLQLILEGYTGPVSEEQIQTLYTNEVAEGSEISAFIEEIVVKKSKQKNTA